MVTTRFSSAPQRFNMGLEFVTLICPRAGRSKAAGHSGALAWRPSFDLNVRPSLPHVSMLELTWGILTLLFQEYPLVEPCLVDSYFAHPLRQLFVSHLFFCVSKCETKSYYINGISICIYIHGTIFRIYLASLQSLLFMNILLSFSFCR